MTDKFSLIEALNRPIYSRKEAELDRGKNLSTTAHPNEVEHDYIDYDPFSHYVSNALVNAEQQHANRRDIIGKWRRVSFYPEVDEAISEIVGEAIVFDSEEQVVEMVLDDIDISDKIKEKMIDIFEHLLYLLDFNKKAEDLFKQWYVDGQLNLEVVYDNKKIKQGIQKLLVLSPYNIWKVRDTSSGEIKYVMKDMSTWDHNQNNYPNPADYYKDAERIFLEDQIVQITSGLWSIDKKTPLSYLNKAMKAINQLYLLEDAVVIWHITRSPEKRVFYIDTGNLPKSKAEEYIKRLIAKYRQKKIYNAETGSVENRSKSISILEDFWLPRNAQGRGTQIDTLQSQAGGMGDLQHIDYFVDKVYRALNIPSSRRQGLGSEGTNIQINNSIDVEKDEMKFFRFILKLRRRFNELFIDLIKKDCLSKKIMTLKEWSNIQEKIRFRYADNNPYSEIKKLQILEMRMGVAGNATTMTEEGYFSKAWIKREILNMTEEEIKEMDKEIKKERDAGEIPPPGGFEMGGGGGEFGGGAEEPQYYNSPTAEPGAPTMGPGGTAEPITQGPTKPFKFNTTAAKKQADRGGKSTRKGTMLVGGEEVEPTMEGMFAAIAELVRSETKAAFEQYKQEQQQERLTTLAKNLKEGDRVTNGATTYEYKNGQLTPIEE